DRLFVGYEDVDAFAKLADAGHPTIGLGRASLDGGGAGLGAEVVRWEVAIALAGALMGINPFDQPDVEAAKKAARTVLEQGVPEFPFASVSEALTSVQPGDYVAIQAFVDPASPYLERFEQ